MVRVPHHDPEHGRRVRAVSLWNRQVERQKARCVRPDPKKISAHNAAKTIHFKHVQSARWKPSVAFKNTDRGQYGDSPCEISFSLTTLWTPLTAISRGSPREIISSVETLKTALAPISWGECSGLSATLWSNLSTETAHVSRA